MTIQEYLEAIQSKALHGRRTIGSEFDMLCEIELLAIGAQERLIGITQTMVDTLTSGVTIDA